MVSRLVLWVEYIVWYGMRVVVGSRFSSWSPLGLGGLLLVGGVVFGRLHA